MKQTYSHIIGFFLLCCCLHACEDAPIISNTPYIKSVQISPETIGEFVAEAIITIEYEDGNGDLGTQSSDEAVVFVKDSRLDEFDTYHIPPLTPAGSSVLISGSINVAIKNLFILGNADQETVFFEVQLMDRGGKTSNLVSTPTVTIVR